MKTNTDTNMYINADIEIDTEKIRKRYGKDTDTRYRQR
jgi:hypothetical protein